MACTSTAPLSQNDIQRFAGEPLHVLNYDPGKFEVRTAGRELFGLPLVVAGGAMAPGIGGAIGGAASGAVGRAATTYAGGKIAQQYQVRDPALLVKQELAELLKDQLGIREVQMLEEPQKSSSRSPKELKTILPDARFVLDVRTKYWSVSHFPTQWNRYRVMILVRARLIDLPADRVLTIADSRIIETYEDNDTAPTYEELFLNDAALLKVKLEEVARLVVADLGKKLISGQASGGSKTPAN